MKITTIKIIAFLMILTTGTFDISAEVAAPTDQHHVILHKENNTNSEVEENCVGHRMVPKPIQCIITYEGVYIEGLNSSTIYMYEVCDEEDSIMVSFAKEQDFIGYLYEVSQMVEIRLYIDDYILIGYLYM